MSFTIQDIEAALFSRLEEFFEIFREIVKISQKMFTYLRQLIWFC